jgi:hypothetical protein
MRYRALDLSFHLNRRIGGITRDIDRGTQSVSTLLSIFVSLCLSFKIIFTISEYLRYLSIKDIKLTLMTTKTLKSGHYNIHSNLPLRSPAVNSQFKPVLILHVILPVCVFFFQKLWMS